MFSRIGKSWRESELLTGEQRWYFGIENFGKSLAAGDEFGFCWLCQQRNRRYPTNRQNFKTS